MRWSRRVIIESGVCRDQRRQINDLPGGRGFGEGHRLVEARTTRPYSKAALSVMGRTVRGRKKRRGRSWLGGPPGNSGLRRLAEVAVVQAADFGKLHDLSRCGERGRPEVGCVLVESEVGPRLMVVGEVAGQVRRRCRSPRTRT